MCSVKQRKAVTLTGPLGCYTTTLVNRNRNCILPHSSLKSFFFSRWTCHYPWTHINFQSQIQRCGSSYKSKNYINQNLIFATGPQRQLYDSSTSFGNTFLLNLTLTLTLFPTESVHFSPSCKATYGWKNEEANHLYFTTLSYSKLGTRWRRNACALICHLSAVQSFVPTIYRIVALVSRFVW